MKRAVIWRAGKMVYSPLVTKYGMNVIAYIDNSPEKRNETIYGLPIEAGDF